MEWSVELAVAGVVIVSRFPAGALEQELVNARRRAIAEAPVERVRIDGRSYRLRRLPDGLDWEQPVKVDFRRPGDG